jgi:hypothetical protein
LAPTPSSTVTSTLADPPAGTVTDEALVVTWPGVTGVPSLAVTSTVRFSVTAAAEALV